MPSRPPLMRWSHTNSTDSTDTSRMPPRRNLRNPRNSRDFPEVFVLFPPRLRACASALSRAILPPPDAAGAAHLPTENHYSDYQPLKQTNNQRCKAVVRRNVRSFNEDDTLQRKRLTLASLRVSSRHFSQPRLRHEEGSDFKATFLHGGP